MRHDEKAHPTSQTQCGRNIPSPFRPTDSYLNSVLGSPGFLFEISADFGPLYEFTRNLREHIRKQLGIHLQAYRRRIREIGTISGTYQNPPCSKPWASAQAFYSKSTDFGHLGIHTESFRTSLKSVTNPFAGMFAAFLGVWGRFPGLTKIRHIFKTMGYSPSFLLKFSRFVHLGIHMESQKQLEMHLRACRRRFKFGVICGTYPESLMTILLDSQYFLFTAFRRGFLKSFEHLLAPTQSRHFGRKPWLSLSLSSLFIFGFVWIISII